MERDAFQTTAGRSVTAVTADEMRTVDEAVVDSVVAQQFITGCECSLPMSILPGLHARAHERRQDTTDTRIAGPERLLFDGSLVRLGGE